MLVYSPGSSSQIKLLAAAEHRGLSIHHQNAAAIEYRLQRRNHPSANVSVNKALLVTAVDPHGAGALAGALAGTGSVRWCARFNPQRERLNRVDLVDPALMPAAIERRIQPRIEDLNR